ncbi:hypothetical protein CL629_01080 [bacterium]|nr:hypothetical protein [bacterium]
MSGWRLITISDAGGGFVKYPVAFALVIIAFVVVGDGERVGYAVLYLTSSRISEYTSEQIADMQSALEARFEEVYWREKIRISEFHPRAEFILPVFASFFADDPRVHVELTFIMHREGRDHIIYADGVTAPQLKADEVALDRAFRAMCIIVLIADNASVAVQ